MWGLIVSPTTKRTLQNIFLNKLLSANLKRFPLNEHTKPKAGSGQNFQLIKKFMKKWIDKTNLMKNVQLCNIMLIGQMKH